MRDTRADRCAYIIFPRVNVEFDLIWSTAEITDPLRDVELWDDTACKFATSVVKSLPKPADVRTYPL